MPRRRIVAQAFGPANAALTAFAKASALKKRCAALLKAVSLAAMIGLTLPAQMSATVLIPADLGELSREAVVVARGQVTSVEARWAEDRRTIETIVTLDVERYLKGAFGSTLQFRVPGGELGRFRSIVVGAPEFAVDDHVVVFLGARGPSVPYVLGFSQGVFRLARAAGSSGWIVTSPALFPAASGTVKVVRGDTTRGAMPVADFEARVRALVAGAR